MSSKLLFSQLLLAILLTNFLSSVAAEEIKFGDAASAFEALYSSRPTFEVIRLADETLVNPITTAFTKAQAAYWGGRASEDIGSFGRAEEFYQVSIAYAPRWWLPVESLFKLYLKTNEAQKAKAFIETLNNRRVPKHVIDSLRLDLSKSTGSALGENHYNLGLLYDSNINQGFSADTIAYFGLPFKASPESKPKAGIGYQLDLSHQSTWFISDKRAVGLSLNADSNDFSGSVGDNYSTRLQLNLYNSDGRHTNINVGRKWYQGDELFDFASFGFVANKKIKPTLNFFVALQAGIYDYESLDNHSGDFTGSSFGVQFPDRSVSSLHLKLSKYKAEDPVFSFTEVGAGVQFSFPKKLIERIGINVMKRNYELIMIEFFKKRDDEIYNVSFDLRDLKILQRKIKTRLVYEKHNSNIAIYERDGWSISFIRQL